jgi:hypothetical protein
MLHADSAMSGRLRAFHNRAPRIGKPLAINPRQALRSDPVLTLVSPSADVPTEPESAVQCGDRRGYFLAEQHKVGIVLYGGTQSPSKGPAEWSASGSSLALQRFAKAVGFSAIPEPSYPEVRWTDKNRWE